MANSHDLSGPSEPEDVALTPIQRRLLEYIADQTSTNGAARGSKKDFARALNCCERSVDRAVTKLRRDGLIEVVSRHAENGMQIPNEYRAR